MKRSVQFGIYILALLNASLAWGQQTTVSPLVAPTAPDLATTMKALEEKLHSAGRITWSQNTYRLERKDNPLRYDAVTERKTFWSEIMNVTADPRSCSLKVRWQVSGTPDVAAYSSVQAAPYPVTGSYYLEEIPGVAVLSAEDFLHLYRHLPGLNPDYHENVSPAFYSAVIITWWGRTDFKFQSREAAEEFAALLRESMRQCSPALQSIRSTASAGPALDETIKFITDKLSAQGRVDVQWTDAIYGTNMLPLAPTKLAGDYYEVTPNATTCTMSFDSVDVFLPIPLARLSFRRIDKIEVLTLKDYLASSRRTVNVLNQDGNNEEKSLQVRDASTSWVLKISFPGIETRLLYFSDEALADRVAKAINHAAELCGAGANREPF